MKVYISADIEGVTGVVSWRIQCGGTAESNPDWAFARRMMTHDVNAAIRGAREAGATHIVVKDSHNNSKNLLIDELEPDVELISGTRASVDGMMDGLDESFDAVFFVGYHAMAGALHGVMEHTITGRVHHAYINGIPSGEQAFSAATAGHYGIPVALVTSDEAGTQEANSFLPNTKVATVKTGMGRYMAKLKHPTVTGPLIQAAAKEAIENLTTIQPFQPDSPTTIKIEFNRSEEGDESSLLQGWKRLDAYTIEQTFDSWPKAHSSTRRAMSYASLASS